MTGLLHRAVLRTRGLPGLGMLYRGIYAGALGFSAHALHALPGLEAVYLHRGLSHSDWEPGVSDIDLILLCGDSPDERALLPRLRARLDFLRRLFPMLGDVWLGSPEELRRYLRWGGLRAWDDVPHWKRLCGAAPKFPALAESPLKRRWLDPWVWLFVSQMEICRRLFTDEGGVPEKQEADIRKLHLDAVRFSDFILADGAAGPHPLSRAQTKTLCPKAPLLTARGLWLDSALRLARASRLVLERTSSATAGTAAFPAAGGPAPISEALGVVSDPPYHTFLLMDDGAAEADYDQAAEKLLADPQPGVAMALGASAWALALQSSYLGAPLGCLDPAAPPSPRHEEDAFFGWGPRTWGETPPVPLLPQRLRWEAAAEAASWMTLWWRSLWIGRGGNRFVLYHLYTRALGLRLMLEDGPSGPFWDWESLLARAAIRWPEERRFLARLKNLLRDEPAATLDSARRDDLRPEHLCAAARLMDGLQAALSATEAAPITR